MLTKDRSRVMFKELAKKDWDFYFTLFGETDRVSHMMYRAIDPKHPMYDADVAAKHGSAILESYKRMDEIVGRVMKDYVDDNTYLQNSVINGLPVASPADLEMLIERHDIRDVLLAIPSASPAIAKEPVEPARPFPWVAVTLATWGVASPPPVPSGCVTSMSMPNRARISRVRRCASFQLMRTPTINSLPRPYKNTR